jgi:serine/threonine-protein kinase
MPAEASLADLAGAILDGTPVDWQLADSGADEYDRSLLNQLRVLAAVADVHRRAPDDGGDVVEWGPLRVLEKVGRGAFGTVYRAWDTRLDREVALKLLPSTTPADETRATTIIEEGRLLARIRHPNVVTIYGAERIGHRIGMWMEFLEGQTLEQMVRGGKRFTEAETVAIGIQLCAAVDAVHKAGLLHRDIKAQNIMVAADGRVVLMDFGAGRELGHITEESLTGTPLYLAPELLVGGRPATVSSDVYACGVVMHRLVTGSFPVHAEVLDDLRAAHRRSERIALADVRPDLSSAFVAAIERATDPDPGRRHQSASDLAAELSEDGSGTRSWHRVKALAMTALVAGVMLVTLESFAHYARRPSPTRNVLAAMGIWPARPGGGAPGDPVIAVLPFTNLSTEAGSEVFVQGLGVEVQSQLAAIKGLRVLSPLSSFPLKDRGGDLNEIRRVLGANLVLSVSVRRSGDRLKVDPQLIQAADGAVIWADSLAGELKDIFAIQQRIALAIVNELRLTLGRGQRRYDTDPRTYELYLKARAYVGLKDPDNAKAAAELFEQVIARDANYAPAHAGLADAYAFWSVTYQGPPTDNTFGERAFAVMRTASARALELDPLLAEAHSALGLVLAREYEWNKAAASFERAIELNPSLTQSYTNYALGVLMPLGKFDESLRVLETARGYDPLSLDVQRITAMVHLFAGRYAEAISAFEAVLKVDPDSPYAVKDYLRALTFGGRVSDALAAYKRDARAPHYQAFAYVLSGDRPAAERLLKASAGFPLHELGIHAALGNMDDAFESLERALISDAQRIALFMRSPEMAAVRADPRYDAIRRRLKLP